VVVVEYIIK